MLSPETLLPDGILAILPPQDRKHIMQPDEPNRIETVSAPVDQLPATTLGRHNGKQLSVAQ